MWFNNRTGRANYDCFLIILIKIHIQAQILLFKQSTVLFQIPKDHDDVIKWKHFPRNWPFVREIHRSPVNFPHKGQWRGALMFSLIYAWINDSVNNREAGDLRRQHGHYDVIVMITVLTGAVTLSFAFITSFLYTKIGYKQVNMRIIISL